MLLDANILIYAVDADSPFHAQAAEWLSQRLNGPRRVGFPWQSLVAFTRIMTHDRAAVSPLTSKQACGFIDDWLSARVAWIPTESARHAEVFTNLVTRYELRGNLVSDAHLAALAIEHGLEMCSADTDFARFAELRWVNPVAPA